ncbi:MAG: DNA polymerase III subunit chi [Gammaproteobacteria bacterium]
MPAVSFYLLTSDSETERYLFVCKLVEKAYRERHRLYILTASEEQARQLDDMLWTFRAGSFVPHQRYNDIPPAQENVALLGTRSAPDGWRQILLNLAAEIPETPDNYERIIEVLDGSEICKQAGRKRYRQYQALGFTVNTYNMPG